VTMQREAAIVGIGRTAFSKESGRTTLAMAAEATRSALADAGLTGGEVDGVVDFQLNDSAAASEVGGAIGARDLSLALDIFGGGNVACLAMAEGIRAVRSGQCDVVVVFRSLNGRSATRFGRGEDSPNLAGEFQYGAANGYIIPPMWIGMWAQRHKHVYGTTAADFGHIAITQRRHASANPHASQRKIITMDDYLASRWIVEPFRLFDCCLETDGAVAIVLTALDRARHLRHKPIIPLAEAEAHTHGNSWSQFPDLTSMYSRYAARRLWDKTDLKPADVDVACMYDCFTYTVLATFEDFGFCDKGEVGNFFAAGRATYGGDVVVNPHGGLLSEGYIHGLNHHYEAALQLRGEANGRQVQNAEISLVTAGAGPSGGAILYGVDR
jgi:acetyl-CoA acetyltransferase